MYTTLVVTILIALATLLVCWLLFRTFPESLKKFKEGTKEDIIRLYESERENIDDLEVDDHLYIGYMLMIIVWNENALTTRNIQKNNVIAAIQGFNGLQPFQSNQLTNVGLLNVPVSDSIFSISDTPTSIKQQICIDIVSELRRLYYQRNAASLGRIYEIQATREGCFEILEKRNVF